MGKQRFMSASVSKNKALVVAALAGGLWLAGCTSDIPEEMTSMPAVSAETAVAAAIGLTPEQAVMKAPGWSQYRRRDKEAAARMRIVRVGREKEEWTSKRVMIEGGVGREESSVRLRVEGGELRLVSTDEPGDEVVTSMEPSMLVLGKSMEVGASERSEFEMVVHPREQPEKVKVRGPASVEVVSVASERVTCGVGEFVCARVRSTLRATLGTGATAAKVVNVTESWYDTGATRVGLVRERQVQRVTVLGVTIRSSDVTWELEDYEGRAGR